MAAEPARPAGSGRARDHVGARGSRAVQKAERTRGQDERPPDQARSAGRELAVQVAGVRPGVEQRDPGEVVIRAYEDGRDTGQRSPGDQVASPWHASSRAAAQAGQAEASRGYYAEAALVWASADAGFPGAEEARQSRIKH
jgi:hypothetical protein